MKTIIEVVGIIFTLPFLVLEAGLKIILYISLFPLIICIAIFYPLIKVGYTYLGFSKNLNWIKRGKKYASTWKKGFYSGYIYKLWKVED